MIKKTIYVVLLICATTTLSFGQIEKDKRKTTKKIARLIEIIERFYVDSVNSPELVDAAIVSMLEKLDPHSAYIPAKKVDEVEAPLKGNFEGVGVRFQILNDTLLVVQAIPGGPSAKLGVSAGDQIIKIDEELVAGVGLSNSGVRKRLLGKKGTKVIMTVQRKGEAELIDFEVTRDKIPIHSVDAVYMVDKEIGYIKINKFARTTVEEFKEGLAKLKTQGMTSLIVDLQDNGGGYLTECFELVDEFLTKDKMIVYTEGRSYERENYLSSDSNSFVKGNLVVLVNESSASASEIFSGAIQDWDRGAIVGRRTFGKGLVQRPAKLPDGSKIRITTQRYYTPSGRSIQKSYENGSKEYRKEKYERFQSGEVFTKDSIKYPDSLIFKTLIKGRNVYAGGGIVPDVFVPVDTTGTSKYFFSLVRKGTMNRFALEYVNQNRDKLKADYPDFKSFKKSFELDKALKEMIAYAEKNKLEFNEEQYNHSKEAISIRLKALIAQNIWGFSEFYEIFNELNPTYKKGVEMLQGRGYKKLKLAKS